MNIVERAIAAVSPGWAAQRALSRTTLDAVRGYEAATTDRRTAGWITGAGSANAEIGPVLSLLRNRGRDLARNDSSSARAVKTLVTYSIGTGIVPSSRATAKDRRRRINKAFRRWRRRCDVDGRYDYFGLQRLAARTVFECGECLVLRVWNRDQRGRARMQIRVIEPDHLDATKTGQRNGENTILDGIEFDANGVRVAYWIYPDHPGDLTASLKGLRSSVRHPAADVIHLYEKDRPSQQRGVPRGVSAFMRVRDLGDYETAELMRKKIESCYAAFIEGGSASNALMNSSQQGKGGRQTEKLQPGMIKYMNTGEKVTFGQPSAIGGYADYRVGHLQSIAAGYGVMYEHVSGDLSRVNFASFKAGMITFRQDIEDFRWLTFIPTFCEGTYAWFVEALWQLGQVDATEDDDEADWVAPQYESIDRLKDAQADHQELRDGTVDLFEVLARKGLDPEEHIEKLAMIAKLLDAHKLTLDSDPRRGPAGARPPAKETPEEEAKK